MTPATGPAAPLVPGCLVVVAVPEAEELVPVVFWPPVEEATPEVPLRVAEPVEVVVKEVGTGAVVERVVVAEPVVEAERVVEAVPVEEPEADELAPGAGQRPWAAWRAVARSSLEQFFSRQGWAAAFSWSYLPQAHWMSVTWQPVAVTAGIRQVSWLTS